MDFSAYSETMDISLMHHGENQPHSYFIPFDVDQNATELRQNSKRFTLLNGTWDFAYYTSVNDLPADFDPFTEPLNAKMPVPGVWQMNGFDAMQYTNVRFPIPYDPPYVPADNPCGLYRHTFIYHKQENRRYTITFEGVDSCLFFYLNNTWIGCSQVTHAPAEYDITDALRNGENTLCALVLKWSFGTYLEDQDKLRYSGIVRDVYILERDESHIIDFDIQTDFTDDFASAAISLKLQQNQPGSVLLTLLDTNGAEIAKTETITGEAHFTVEHPVLWSAESPSLYTLLLTCGNEKIARHIGLRKINIKNEIVLLNGKPIRFKGVNLHESRAETGACASREDLLQDLTLMKRHNINAVRTSHYPQSPLFYELCEELGVYVLDEADMECHGVVSLKGGYEQNDYNLIADDPAFGAAILDRVQRMVLRDRNFSCVLIYSMGNESGYGVNFAEALHWTKQFDPSRLTHYERASFPPAGQDINRTDLDLYSRMYPSIEEMRSYFVNHTIHKPYILCEFCHAMGNGPGDLEDYFQLFESEPRICGAFVWEWCDHAPYIGLNSDGKPMYRYGGDFGESLHDGNFCADGLVSSNRTPHTGLLEYRNVLRPVRILEADLVRGKLTVKNQLDIITPDTLVNAVFTLSKAGQADVEWKLDDQQLHIEPHQTAEISIPVCDSCAVSYTLKKTTIWAEKGTLLGYEQIGEAETRIKPIQRKTSSLTVQEVNRRSLDIQGEGFCYRFDRLTGLFIQLTANGNAMLQKPMAINLFRAPTDNDRNIKELWYYLQYRYAVCRCLRCDIMQNVNQITLRCETHVSAQSMGILANGVFTWTISGDGRITCEADFQRASKLLAFPRFGLRLLLPKAFDSLDAHAFGPYESYVDKHRASTLCDFSAKVDEQYSHPLRPQESGSHYGTTALRLHAADSGFSVFGKGFTFSALPYLQEQLTDTMHDDELKTTDACVLCLDFAHAGIGSNSCGPALAKCYETPEHITGTIVIDPLG